MRVMGLIAAAVVSLCLTAALLVRARELAGVNQLGARFNAPDENWYNDATVFVGVASYRDVQCMPTVRDAFFRATNPRRVFFGIIEQNEHGDPDCIPPEFHDCRSAEFCPIDNVKRRRVAARRGKGPTYGRYVSFLLYRDETYYMMIDSHNMFVRHWERISITQLFRTQSPRPVLSHYPNGLDDVNRKGMTYESQGHMMVMCKGIFVEHLGYVRNGARWMSVRLEPRLQPFTAAGYLFADSRLVHEVPFDPYLDYIFDGEELALTARLYTRGFDPATIAITSVVNHDYNRHSAPRYFSLGGVVPGYHQEMTISQQRAQYLLKVVRKGTKDDYLVREGQAPPRVFEKFDIYGLGKERTLESLYEMGDVDMVKRHAGEGYCNWLDKQDIKFASAPVR
jgi:UDP-GlcNAc:polypeptide alpha-N-acetylglucosaminyltransferase